MLDGGATLNPSTYELLAGIHEVPAEEVVVLPNSPNVRMAAERAAELSEKTVRVVADALDGLRASPPPSRWTRPRRADNAAAMEEALSHVRTGGVTEAARDDTQGRFRRGDSVGFIDEELVAWGEPGETLEVVLGELGREAELLTVIEGDGAPLGSEAVAALAPDEHRGRALAWRPAGLVVAGLSRVGASRSPSGLAFTISGRGAHPVRHLADPAAGRGAVRPTLPQAVAAGVSSWEFPGEKAAKAAREARVGQRRRAARSTSRATAARRARWPS